MAVVTDSFTYSNGNLQTVSSAWTVLRTGGQNIAVDTNQIKGAAAADSPYYINSFTAASARMYAQMKVTTLDNGMDGGLLVCADTALDGSRAYYQANIFWTGSSYAAAVNKFAAGTGTQIGTTPNVTIANGDTVKFTYETGDVLNIYINGVLVVGPGGSDSALNANRRVGILTDDTSPARWDDFEGGDIATVSAQIPRQTFMVAILTQ